MNRKGIISDILVMLGYIFLLFLLIIFLNLGSCTSNIPFVNKFTPQFTPHELVVTNDDSDAILALAQQQLLAIANTRIPDRDNLQTRIIAVQEEHELSFNQDPGFPNNFELRTYFYNHPELYENKLYKDFLTELRYLDEPRELKHAIFIRMNQALFLDKNYPYPELHAIECYTSHDPEFHYPLLRLKDNLKKTPNINYIGYHDFNFQSSISSAFINNPSESILIPGPDYDFMTLTLLMRCSN